MVEVIDFFLWVILILIALWALSVVLRIIAKGLDITNSVLLKITRARQKNPKVSTERAPMEEKLEAMKVRMLNDNQFASYYGDYLKEFSNWYKEKGFQDKDLANVLIKSAIADVFIERKEVPPDSFIELLHGQEHPIAKIRSFEKFVFDYWAIVSEIKKTYTVTTKSESEGTGIFDKSKRAGESHSQRSERLEEEDYGGGEILLTNRAIHISTYKHSETINYDDIAKAIIVGNRLEITKNRAPEEPIFIYSDKVNLELTSKIIYTNWK